MKTILIAVIVSVLTITSASAGVISGAIELFNTPVEEVININEMSTGGGSASIVSGATSTGTLMQYGAIGIVLGVTLTCGGDIYAKGIEAVKVVYDKSTEATYNSCKNVKTYFAKRQVAKKLAAAKKTKKIIEVNKTNEISLWPHS